MIGNLLSNETFARIAARLGLPERIITAAHQQTIVRGTTVARATVFEAYVGGMLVSGIARADVLAFVEAIFSPIIHYEYEFVTAAAGTATAATAPIAPTAPGELTHPPTTPGQAKLASCGSGRISYWRNCTRSGRHRERRHTCWQLDYPH